MRGMTLTFMLVVWAAAAATVSAEPPSDRLTGPGGEVTITFIGHGSLILGWNGVVVHVDPYSRLADYASLPKADLILVTHEHRDHLDADAIAAIRGPHTHLILNAAAAAALGEGEVLANGERTSFRDIAVTAVPAYNLVHMRSAGVPFHPRGEGNGYLVDLGGLRIYIAGDTENVPEMADLTGVDVAFLPMNLPYTMTPEMVAAAARSFTPRILYPYHYGETDPAELVRLLADEPGIEVRVRPMR
jgi:L-ascorbate metabolism protein UlaG (beta-lactamase superfamily)